MENLSIENAVKKIQTYLNQSFFRPYFVISDDPDETRNLAKNFSDFRKIYVSDFCRGDTPLDGDLLIDELNNLETNAICFGLGEYVYFTGQKNIPATFRDRSFSRKVIFICRGISNLLEQMSEDDPKFRATGICKISGRLNLSVVKYNPDTGIKTDAENFSKLLKFVETGKNLLSVKSDLPLQNVKEIKNFYEAIKYRNENFSQKPDALPEEFWREYFFDDKCENYPPEHWRSFAAGFKDKISDSYLNLVFARSENYEEYKQNLFSALLDADADKKFPKFYAKRKDATKNLSGHYLKVYLNQLRKKEPELQRNIIHYLTDNTPEECHEMIRAIQGRRRVPENFKKNFPATEKYLRDYDFGDKKIDDYFRRYKEIKLCNIDDENFKNDVQQFGLERPYNKFPTRRQILERADKNAKLYWLDALGVEFLSYIKIRAKEEKIFAKVEIARAELPTLTSINKNFYDDWSGERFPKNQKLDDLKHSPEKFDDKGKCSAPIYVCEELKIIDAVIDEIKNSLTTGENEKIILTSDHGASRLAVMYGRGDKIKMSSGGEHSGRCCPANEIDERPDFATEENGYFVSANYSAFSGGRLSSVEVHGGATLEEVLIPVIEFSLSGEKIPEKNFTPEVEDKPEKNSPLTKPDDSFDFFD